MSPTLYKFKRGICKHVLNLLFIFNMIACNCRKPSEDGSSKVPVSKNTQAIITKPTLDLKLAYDTEKKELTYSIQNTGEVPAKNGSLSLHYQNTSSTAAEKQATLGGATEQTIAIPGNIAPHQITGNQILILDFKGQKSVQFTFAIRHQGVQIIQEVKTYTLLADGDIYKALEANEWDKALQLIPKAQAEAINYQDPTTGYTPLMLAAQAGETTIVNLLLQYGADTRTEETVSHQQAYTLAINAGQDGIAQVLAQAEARTYPASLYNALQYKYHDFKKATYMLNGNPPKETLNYCDNSTSLTNTPLSMAICREREGKDIKDIVEKLLQQGATIDDGALFVAWDRGNTDMMELLFEHGAMDKDGKILHWASCTGNYKIAIAAIGTGHDIDIINRSDHAKSRTPLMGAVENNDAAMVMFLLNCGARTDVQDEDGNTALDLATDESIKKLIQDHISKKV